MIYQLLPNVILIVSLLGIFLLIIRRVPEAVTMHKREQRIKAADPVESHTTSVGASKRVKSYIQFFFKRLWVFLLEAKDLKPQPSARFRIKKMLKRKGLPLTEVKTEPLIPPLVQSAPQPTIHQPEVRTEDYYLNLIKQNPKELTHFAELGKFYVDTGSFLEAVKVYHYLVKLESANPSYYAKLGYSLFKAEDFEGSVNAYEKSLALDSAQPNRYYNLGLALESLARFEEALKAFKKAQRIDPGNNKYKEAVAHIQKTIREKSK